MGPIVEAPDDPVLLAMGFVFAHPQVDTAIVGTGSLSHLRSNIEMMEKGVTIPRSVVEELYRRFDALGERWLQMK